MTASRIQVSLNGAIVPENHPQLRLSLQDLVQDAVACARLGASDFHVHPRNKNRFEAIDAETVETWVTAFRIELPRATISVSTGAWIAPLAERLDAIAGWCVKPDYASVNFHEDGAEEVANALLDRGVGVEAGVWHQEGARRFLNYARRSECRRLMFEMPDESPSTAEAVLQGANELLGGVSDGHDLILHGEGRSAWPMLGLALDKGMGARIGLEDTVWLPDGRLARDNASLFAAAVRLMSSAAR